MGNREIAVKIKGVKKQYRLGQIGGGSLQADLQSWWAKVRGKEDPNRKIGDNRIYGEAFMALNGIDLTIYEGERVGIIGRNGAGKSTLLKLLSRVTAPTEGEIDIFGRITSMLEVGTGFNGEMTGRENVYMNGAILGMTKNEMCLCCLLWISHSLCFQHPRRHRSDCCYPNHRLHCFQAD